MVGLNEKSGGKLRPAIERYLSASKAYSQSLELLKQTSGEVRELLKGSLPCDIGISTSDGFYVIRVLGSEGSFDVQPIEVV